MNRNLFFLFIFSFENYIMFVLVKHIWRANNTIGAADRVFRVSRNVEADNTSIFAVRLNLFIFG